MKEGVYIDDSGRLFTHIYIMGVSICIVGFDTVDVSVPTTIQQVNEFLESMEYLGEL